MTDILPTRQQVFPRHQPQGSISMNQGQTLHHSSSSNSNGISMPGETELGMLGLVIDQATYESVNDNIALQAPPVLGETPIIANGAVSDALLLQHQQVLKTLDNLKTKHKSIIQCDKFYKINLLPNERNPTRYSIVIDSTLLLQQDRQHCLGRLPSL